MHSLLIRSLYLKTTIERREMNLIRIFNIFVILSILVFPSAALAQKRSITEEAARNAGTRCKTNHRAVPGAPYADKLAESYCISLVRDGLKVLRKASLQANGLDLKTESGQTAFANRASQILEQDQEFARARRQAELAVVGRKTIQTIVWGTIGAYMYEDLKAPRLKSTQTSSAQTGSAQTGVGNGRKYAVQTNSHINTGISVNPGDKIRVQASGRIRFGFVAGSGGPMGIIFNPDYNYFIDIPHGQLMGRIKQFGAPELDGWFPIGEGREFVVRSQGVLEFAVNDNNPRDNAGRFRIEVIIIPTK